LDETYPKGKIQKVRVFKGGNHEVYGEIETKIKLLVQITEGPCLLGEQSKTSDENFIWKKSWR